MVKVFVGNNLTRNNVIVESTTTLRKVLEDNNVNYSRGVMHLNGAPLNSGDLDKTFEQMGVTETCYLLNVTKADNA